MNSAFAATAWTKGDYLSWDNASQTNIVENDAHVKFFLGLGDTVNSAKKLAFASCKSNGYKCNLEISCKGKGWYASVQAWNSDKKTVTGVSCGSNSRDDALKLAAKYCKKEGGIGCNTTTEYQDSWGDIFYSIRRSGYDPDKPLTPTDTSMVWHTHNLCGVNDNFKKVDFFEGTSCHVKEFELKYDRAWLSRSGLLAQ